MIAGVGIDIVEVERIRAARLRWSERFLRRVFTENELGYCLPSAQRDQRLAARFAAKEAFLKALGTGLSLGGRWNEIEVRSDRRGAPSLGLTGRPAALLRERGIGFAGLSISHTKKTAVAVVILEETAGPPIPD
jgi:holo-[acyl-carrier protein] synthase